MIHRINDESAPPLIGETINLIYAGSKSLSEIARVYDVGHIEIREANPRIDANRPVSGEEIIIPTSWILPVVMDEGILINLAELRLYFFEPANYDSTQIRTFPIGIGRSGYETPTGNFRVTEKLKDPIWFPPKTSRKFFPYLPMAVPPGARNPLGRYWIQLDLEGYGIHGTNKAASIGKKVSLGCIRLSRENIKWLFHKAYRGMPVKIVNIPVKFGYFKNRLYMEVHKNGLSHETIWEKARQLAREEGIDTPEGEFFRKIIDEGLGIPVPLSKEKSAPKEDHNNAKKQNL
ncbi:MAG: L,D-transpeptidase family protein [Deltaproteobacteria bacterium]|nr:L,D-transpeptidase family protein [Deltaproteobacteria bacterium]